MATSEKVRNAFESGQKEAREIRTDPIGWALSPSANSRPTDPDEAAAYDKGLCGEQLDGDKRR